MKMIFAALALSIAVPAIAHAQKFPVPAPLAPVEAKKGCCEKMKAKMDCCKAMGDDKSHAGHDMKPSANSHQNHH